MFKIERALRARTHVPIGAALPCAALALARSGSLP